MTNEQFSTLQNLLNGEADCYAQAVERMRTKKEALLKNDLDTLEKTDQELMALHQRARSLEQKRLQLTGEMGYHDIPLSELIPQLPAEYAGVLAQTRKRLISLVRELEQLNRNHVDLLTLSLKWVEESVTVIAEILTPQAASYGAQTGKKGKGRSPAPPSQAPPQSTFSHQA